MDSLFYLIVLCGYSYLQLYVAADYINKDTKSEKLYDQYFDKSSLVKKEERHESKGCLSVEKKSYSKDNLEQLPYTYSYLLFQIYKIKKDKTKNLRQSNIVSAYKLGNQFYKNPITPDERDIYGKLFNYGNFNTEIPHYVGASKYEILRSHPNGNRSNTQPHPYELCLTHSGTTHYIRTRRARSTSGTSSHYMDRPYYIEPSLFPLYVGLRRPTRGGPRPPPNRGPPNHAGRPPHKGPPNGGPPPQSGPPPHRGPPPHAGPPQNGKNPPQGGPPPKRGPSTLEGSSPSGEPISNGGPPPAANSYLDVYQNQHNINDFTATNPIHYMYINGNNQEMILANTPQNSTPTATRPPLYWFQAQAVTPEE